MSQNFAQEMENIKKNIEQLTAPKGPGIVRLTQAAFTNVGPELQLIRTENTGPISIDKRSISYVFKKPVYVQSIRMCTKALSLKKISLLFSGAPSDLSFREIGKVLPLAGDDTLTVGSVIHGFEIICAKKIHDHISLLEIFGSEDVSLASIGEFSEKFAASFDFAKTALLTQMGDLGKLDADLAKEIEAHKALPEKIQAAEKQKANLEEELKSLNQDLTAVKEATQSCQKEKDELAKDITVRKGGIDDLQIKAEDLRSQINAVNNDLRALRQEKSLYNETLVGHKRETTKQIWVNLGLMACLLVLDLITIVGAGWLVHDAIAEVKSVQDNVKMSVLLGIRSSAGVLVYFILRHSFISLNGIFQRTYALIADRRAIEGKLILARAVAESSHGKLDVGDEERRAYASFLAFSVLKNHFLNMSLDSIAEDLQIEPNKLAKQLPRIPSRFADDSFIKDFLKTAVRPEIKLSAAPTGDQRANPSGAISKEAQ